MNNEKCANTQNAESIEDTTPRPWSVEIVKDSDDLMFCVINSSKGAVAHVVSTLCQENGELIVKAVNAYDTLKDKNKALEERVAELEEEVERLGEMGNVCTYSITKKVCRTCKCPRLNKTKEG